jgi:hypothetical protein
MVSMQDGGGHVLRGGGSPGRPGNGQRRPGAALSWAKVA